MTLIFASNNPHKLEEALRILPKVRILSLEDIGLHADIPETSDTLDGNSRQKADYVYGWCMTHKEQLPEGVSGCFADDTGLEIAALGGRPGVYTARFAGEECSPADNRAKTLRLMEGKKERDARFRTVVTLIEWGRGDDATVHQFSGEIRGSIATEEVGDHGFGYDPIFIPEGYTETFAQLPSTLKNSISHRARAMQALADYLEQQ